VKFLSIRLAHFEKSRNCDRSEVLRGRARCQIRDGLFSLTLTRARALLLCAECDQYIGPP